MLQGDGWPPGHMTKRELGILQGWAGERPRVLEIGSLYGRSAVALAKGAGTNGSVRCIDPWPDAEVYQAFVRTVRGLDHTHALVSWNRDLAEGAAERLRGLAESEPFDLVFVDGDHSEEAVRHDILLGADLLRSGGRLAGHDFKPGRWPGVVAAVKELLPDYRVEPHTTLWSVIVP